jgi:hypothetical protein
MDKKMAKHEPSHRASHTTVTLAIYLGAILLLLAVIAYCSRSVLFQPWTSRVSLTLVAADTPQEEILFAIGGRRPNKTQIDDVHAIMPSRGRISTVLRDSVPALGSAAATAGGRLYVLGGSTQHGPSSQLLEVDPHAAEVRRVAQLPAPRAYAAAAALAGRIYLFGGWDGTRKGKEIFRFDPADGAVSKIGEMPEAREQLETVVIEGAIYLLGGYGEENAGSRKLWRFDPQSGSCSQSAELPENLGKVSAAGIGRELFILTPQGNNSALLYRCHPQEERIRWVVHPLPLPARQLELGASEGSLYAVGGSHPRFQRRLGVWKILYERSDVEARPLRVRGYSWN